MEEEVILVDENDQEIGTAEKLRTHREGCLHRAFSIFVFSYQGELLLQRRAKMKYHSPGLWSNTCCSHPKPGEITESAAHRRLKEEMGFDCELKELFSFIYKVKFENGLSENEYDHVFIGRYDGRPKINPKEVCDWKYVDLNKLQKILQKNPNKYTYWLRISFDKLLFYLKDNNKSFGNFNM